MDVGYENFLPHSPFWFGKLLNFLFTFMVSKFQTEGIRDIHEGESDEIRFWVPDETKMDSTDLCSYLNLHFTRTCPTLTQPSIESRYRTNFLPTLDRYTIIKLKSSMITNENFQYKGIEKGWVRRKFV